MKPTIVIEDQATNETKSKYHIIATYDKVGEEFVAGEGNSLSEAIADLLESFQYAPDFIARINAVEFPKKKSDTPEFIKGK